MVGGSYCETLFDRHIKALGSAVFKNIAAVSYILPFFAVYKNIAMSLKHYKSGFLITGKKIKAFSGVKLNYSEFQHFKAAFPNFANRRISCRRSIFLFIIHNRSPLNIF